MLTFFLPIESTKSFVSFFVLNGYRRSGKAQFFRLFIIKLCFRSEQMERFVRTKPNAFCLLTRNDSYFYVFFSLKQKPFRTKKKKIVKLFACDTNAFWKSLFKFDGWANSPACQFFFCVLFLMEEIWYPFHVLLVSKRRLFFSEKFHQLEFQSNLFLLENEMPFNFNLLRCQIDE